jgi:hypothetical protein
MGPLIAVYFAEARTQRAAHRFPFFLDGVRRRIRLAIRSVVTAALLAATHSWAEAGRHGARHHHRFVAALMVLVFPIADPAGFPDAAAGEADRHSAAAALAQTATGRPATGTSGFSGWTERTFCFVLLGIALWPGCTTISSTRVSASNSTRWCRAVAGAVDAAQFRRVLRAMAKAIVSCWPVIVLYQLYGGVAGVLQFTVGSRSRNCSHLATPLRFRC